MPISEAARAHLYTGLAEVLGTDRAETLMAHLPHFDPADVATESDVAAVRVEIAELRSELKSDIAVVRDGLAAVNQRLDRLFQTLLVRMFGVAAALVGPAFASAR